MKQRYRYWQVIARRNGRQTQLGKYATRHEAEGIARSFSDSDPIIREGVGTLPNYLTAGWQANRWTRVGAGHSRRRKGRTASRAARRRGER